MRSLLLSRKQVAGLIETMGALTVCLHLTSTSKPRPIHYQTLREFKEFAVSKGLCFPEQPMFKDNFFIADHALSVEAVRELASIRKWDCGLTPAWRGLLWVCAIHSPYWQVESETIGGKKRIWGRLLVAGDEGLMDRIEELVRAE
jgi:hypothetical protein